MSKKRKIWFAVLGVALLAIVTIALLLQHWMNTNNTGTVHVGTPTPNSPVAPTQPLAIQTSYFTTTLPAGFSLKRQSETPSGDPQLQLLAATPSTVDEQFSAGYSQIPSGGLTSVGDYNLRASQTSTYTPYTPKDLPAGAKAFRTVSGPPSFVVFWPHTNHYAELAVSTDNSATLDQLQTVFSQVINSWQWK
jgi:hypothetical protein